MKRRRRKTRRDTIRRRNVFYYTISLACLALLITGIYIVGNEYNRPEGNSEISGRDPSAEASSLISSSEAGSSALTSSSVSSQITETPAPTDPPYSYIESELSTKKLGWDYIPGGAEGIPATNYEERITICKRFGGIWQGDTSKKKIYITMDLGYEYNNNTAKILDIAKNKDFKINFFIVGKLFTYPQYKDLLMRIHDEGHLVCSHAWHHDNYDELYLDSGAQAVRDDLKQVEEAYNTLTGSELAKLFRFPAGEYSEAAMSVVDKAGFKSVFWSFSYRDWLVDEQPDPQESLEKMINGLHNGAVYLLHPVSDTNVEVLPELVEAIRSRGYEIALLDEFE